MHDPQLFTHDAQLFTHDTQPKLKLQSEGSNIRISLADITPHLILLFWLKNLFIKYVIHNIVIHCRVPKCRPYLNVIVAIATTITSFLLIIPNSKNIVLYKSHNSRFLTLKRCVVKMWNIKYII